MAHRVPLLFFAVAIVCGICLDQWIGACLDSLLSTAHVLTVWIPLFLLFAIAATFCKSTTRWIAFLAAVVPLSAARHAISDANYEAASIAMVAGTEPEPAILDVTIDRPVVLRRHPLADLPGRRDQPEWQTLIEASVDRVRIGQEYVPHTGRLLVVSEGRLDQFFPGDRVRVFGSLRRFPAPTNPGERDLRSVYRRRGLHARIDANENQISRLQDASSISLYRALAVIAGRSRDLLLKHTGDTTGPLALALILGQREFVDDDTRDRLLVTGTAHLLSVSGLHLAIVVLLASWMATLLQAPKRLRILWVVLVCILYTSITGGRPPVVRAAILVTAFMISLWIRRQGQAINSLSLAGILLMLYNPEYVFGVGMQLSFLAVATLILCGRRPQSSSPAIEQALQREERLQTLMESTLPAPTRVARWFGYYVWQMIWFSACVTFVTIPLVWYQFHVVSIVSVLTNVLLSMFLLVTLASGIATVVIGALITDTMATVPGSICHWLLEAMHYVIKVSAQIPYGHAWLPAPPTWCVALFYVVIGWSLLWNASRRNSILRRLWIPIWMLGAWWISTTPSGMDGSVVEATFVDVGHGTSVVLRFSEDDVWLYDCGRMGNDRGSSRDIDVNLWSLGVTRLSGIVLSHADSDHYNALPGILQRFDVEKIVTAPGMLETAESGLVKVRHAIATTATPVHEVSIGDELIVQGQPLRILHPTARGVVGSDNANSLVLSIPCEDTVVMLPGDLESPGSDELVRQKRPPAGGVLMAPHHGSLTSDARAVLQWARPREVIVSGGQRARRPAVREMLAVTGSGVHVTAEVGAIRVRIATDHQIKVRSWLESPW